jgi:hypothetical protein
VNAHEAAIELEKMRDKIPIIARDIPGIELWEENGRTVFQRWGLRSPSPFGPDLEMVTDYFFYLRAGERRLMVWLPTGDRLTVKVLQDCLLTGIADFQRALAN